MGKKKNVHASALGTDRWKGKSKRQRSAHMRMMVQKRWAAYRARKAQEEAEKKAEKDLDS